MGRRVLVIDDDEIAREMLVSVLRDGGYDTFELPSPIGATNIILREKIDILVLDILMPQMSGEKLAKLLRSNPRLSDLPIILVSGCRPEELANTAQAVKADAVVVKGEARSKLLQAVARAKLSARPTRFG